MTPQDMIAALKMERHPEGGWYVQTFRDAQGGSRGHSTCIYYLLERGQRSHWHKVTDATEIWHFYAGSMLNLHLSQDGVQTETHRLGPAVLSGERPQVIVGPGVWQSAESSGDWTLVGCTVAPGFEFSAFEMAPPDWVPGQ
jgi:uncharacterized protein